MPERPPPDPALHAVDFSQRYAEDLEIATGQAMIDLGLTRDQMGAKDWTRGGEHHTFYPEESSGGTVSPDGRIMLDSGIMNPELMADGYDEATQQLWKRTRLPDRIKATIAHELAEHETGSHEGALESAPDTELPVGPHAKRLLESMRDGWRGR
ncbi:hypothetical protein TA3x_001110 [Tundrisphaera sp. TA3]|uniref:hypothetical protein n=1 Tax=Tundrisphaera sp. TA3 TaxID=3435775 RepID=UPI003EBAC898